MGSLSLATTTTSTSRADEPEGEVEDIDPWGAEDDLDDDEVREHSFSTQSSSDLHREWEARRLQFHNLGYRDGITAGNNSSVQEGFDSGFKEAVGPGFGWGVARGAASAYTSLPTAMKELLLKDQVAGKRLEALHSTLSSISSADAMGIYYKDTILQKGANAEDSVQGHSSESSRNVSSVQTPIEEETKAKQIEKEDTATACCGRGSCGDSKACSSDSIDGVSTTARHSILDGSSPQSAATSVALDERSGNEPVSEEAREFISRVGTSSGDAKQLEDSTTGHLVSMALGQSSLGASSSRASECSSRLEEYQRNVAAELEHSNVKLSSFPPSSQTSGGTTVI
ncbi:unnamed protein product [Calypogeia fissa]